MVDVHDNPSLLRFEIHDDDMLAGFAQYVRRSGRIFFVHTEIDPEFEGKGLGSRLAAGALAAERPRAKFVPLCPFIRSFIDRHPDELANVDKELLDRIDAD